MANKFRKILNVLFSRDNVVSPEALQPASTLSDRDIRMLKVLGVTYNELQRSMEETTAINFERSGLYREIERSLSHWMMSAAVELYADYACTVSPVQNRSIWVSSKDTKYYRTLEKFLDELQLEEKMHDWASTTGGFGDMFVKVNGHPGLGVVSIDDSFHPSAISRIDHDGVLLGFYQTPFDAGGMASGVRNHETEMQAPWQYVHFRLLGASKRRPGYADPVGGIEHRTIYLMGAESKQISTKYGTSLLFNGLPVYKRLRLAEDALLLARVNRGILKYIYKIKVDSCLRGDTKIQLASGEFVTIKEMADNHEDYIGKEVWTICPKTENTRKNKIFDIYKTRQNAEMVRVKLSNGRYVDCTPDHLFMMGDGRYVEAQKLETGDVLMSWGSDSVSVLIVEKLEEREDTYDITIENVPNFPVEAGVFLHNSNPEAAGQLVQEYMNILKHARALNTNEGQEGFESKSNMMAGIEDLFVPVFGETGDIQIEKIGGEADIKWICDIEELRNQLACSLRVPLSLLGGYVQEASGQLGSEVISQLDIRFARASRRLQRALISGVKRLCQIHLSYLGMDPDPRLFDIQMGENSTAEDQQLKEALDTSTDVIGKFMDMIDNLGVEIDKVAVFDYLNKKISKLSDFDLKKFIKDVAPEVDDEEIERGIGMGGRPSPAPGRMDEPVGEEDILAVPDEAPGEEPIVVDSNRGIGQEFYTYMPLNDKVESMVFGSMNESAWKKQYESTKVIIEESSCKNAL
jgi:intein/homing endonuclease